jgi:hypothetical protein
MSVQGPFRSGAHCHWTVGSGNPVAAAENPPDPVGESRITMSGCALTIGA